MRVPAHGHIGVARLRNTGQFVEEAQGGLARFQAMMAEGTLRPAAEVADIILHHIAQGSLKHGALHDLREMV